MVQKFLDVEDTIDVEISVDIGDFIDKLDKETLQYYIGDRLNDEVTIPTLIESVVKLKSYDLSAYDVLILKRWIEKELKEK